MAKLRHSAFDILSITHPATGKFVGLHQQLNATRCLYFGEFIRNYPILARRFLSIFEFLLHVLFL